VRVVGAALAALMSLGVVQGGDVRLELNVPAYRLEVLRDDSVIRRFRVSVGMRSDPTPLGEFAVTEVTWNPWWHPPDREWARKDTVTPPGATNPMGVVKLLIGGLYFVHGTPFEATIGLAASHGCVRLRNADAIELARILLRVQPYGGLLESAGDLVQVPATTLVRPLITRVPILVRYALVEVSADSLTLHPDLYHLRRGTPTDDAFNALVRGGVDTARVNRAVLDSLARRSARRETSVPLSRLLRRS
jgi:murein L,D-transpeptidase YcbB/YkuD